MKVKFFCYMGPIEAKNSSEYARADKLNGEINPKMMDTNIELGFVPTEGMYVSLSSFSKLYGFGDEATDAIRDTDHPSWVVVGVQINNGYLDVTLSRSKTDL